MSDFWPDPMSVTIGVAQVYVFWYSARFDIVCREGRGVAKVVWSLNRFSNMSQFIQRPDPCRRDGFRARRRGRSARRPPGGTRGGGEGGEANPAILILLHLLFDKSVSDLSILNVSKGTQP